MPKPKSRPQQIYDLVKEAAGKPITYEQLCTLLMIPRYEISGLVYSMVKRGTYPGITVVTVGTERVKTHNHTLNTRKNPIKALKFIDKPL